jgi:hypothetical protein
VNFLTLAKITKRSTPVTNIITGIQYLHHLIHVGVAMHHMISILNKQLLENHSDEITKIKTFGKKMKRKVKKIKLKFIMLIIY